jgi:hypothetical protein
MNKEIQKQLIAELVIQGKEQGYLYLNDIYEYLPANSLSIEQLDKVINIFKNMGIKVIKPVDEGKKLKDSDTEQMVDMISELAFPESENIENAVNSELRGYVEVRDNSLWIKHIYQCETLQKILLEMKQNILVELELDGVKGQWIKMSDGKDGRKTNGIKPIGNTKKFWLKMQKRRGELVSIKKI